MRPYYLLDTCILSEPAKPVPDKLILEKMEASQKLCAISSIAWHELLYGVNRLPDGQKKRLLHEYVMQVIAPSYPVMDYDEHAAWIHAEIRCDCEKNGLRLPFADGQIAAIARTNNMILVTKNRGHFESIRGLATEDWSSPG